jgi:dihydrofolate synthase/folylpolyglutamate synthase
VGNPLNPDLVLDFERVLAALNDRAAENVIKPSLDRISYLLTILGDPHKAYDVIHVAGTNGKTSTSRMIESLLSAAGLNVGLTTSPHLHDVRERIRIYGASIEFEKFIEAYDDIAPFLEMTDAEFADDVRLSYFETLTAMSFSAFAEAPVDVAVVEVGLGGRWDATNVVQPKVCVITPIGLDHQDYLGDTIEQIAAEKAGIIKPDSIVVCGQQQAAALEVIQRKADAVGAALLIQDRDFGVSERSLAIGGQIVSIKGIGGFYDEIVLPLHGEHQAHNAALALAAVEAFFGAGIDGRAIDTDVVREGFGKATSPARLEVVRRGPTVIVDAAHNPHGAHALVQALEDEFSFTTLIFVLAMFADKDSLGFIGEVEPLADHVIVTQAVSPRALDVDTLFAQAATIVDEEILKKAADLPSALELAIQIADEATAVADESVGIVVTGSVVTAAQARALLGKKRA